MSDTFDHEAEAWDSLDWDADLSYPGSRIAGPDKRLRCSLVAETDKAWLVECVETERQHWLPKSRCSLLKAEPMTAVIPDWLWHRKRNER